MFLGLADNIFVDTPSLGTPGLGWVLQSGGVQATLDIDFVVGRAISSGVISSIPSLLTCTRATPAAAYYQNADLTLSTFAANTLRFGSNGLLVEESRTNLILQSQALDVTWGLSTATILANSATAPDGTLTADKIQEDNTNNVHLASQTITVVGSTAYSITAYVKPSERTIYRMDPAEPAVANNPSYFSLVGNGSVLSNSVGNVGSITLLANGWYRCQITRTTSPGQVSMIVQVGPSNADYGAGSTGSYQGVTGSGVFVWGVVVEAGAFATSYIPTTTVAVTRATDLITFSSQSWLVDNGAGTYYANALTPNLTSLARIWGAAGSKTPISRNNTDNNIGITFNGATSLTGTTGGPLWSTGSKIAAASNGATDRAIVMGGGVAGADSAGFGTLTTVYIGSDNGASSWNGYIKEIAYWPTRLSNAELQRLTT